MKPFFIFLILTPALNFAQKIKVNEYDRFIKQNRIESEPLPVLSSDNAKVFLTFNALGSGLYLEVSGYGWGNSAVDEGQEMIFLFSNDSTVMVKSTALQTFEVLSSTFHSTYKHTYFIKVSDIKTLSENDLVGIRKYGLADYKDLKVSPENALKLKRSSALFLAELKKAKIINPLRQINITDISKHIGDSVWFCSKVYSTRYFESSPNKPTLLDVNDSYSGQLLNIIIWEEDRKNFFNAPESLYNKKDVCINGIVQLYNNMPHIFIRSRTQITLKSPISLSEVQNFVGDSVTVYGKVLTSKLISTSPNSPTLLNMGAAYPDQLLTLVIENKNRAYFSNTPETYYINKAISVTGKIELYNGKPQIAIHNKNQISEIAEELVKVYDPNGQVTQVVTNTESVPYASATPEKKKPANFPGGQNALLKYFNNNIVSPEGKLAFGEKKIVVAKFLIGTDGTPGAIEITQPGGSDFDKEVIRVIKNMPKWEPQTVNGVPVPVSITQQLTFFRQAK